MKKLGSAGIDVSAKHLVVVIEKRGRRSAAEVFDNDAPGHKKLIRHLTKGGWQVRVVLESTGTYGLDLSLALHRANRVEVMVANPRAVSKFAGAMLGRSKTDPLDAEVLLEFALRMPFVTWQAPAPEILDLRALSRRIAQLTKMQTQEKNRLHAASQPEGTHPFALESLETMIRLLGEQIEATRQQALALIADHERLRKPFGHLVSIKGIAEASAIAILAELAVLPADMTVRQWVAHAGLDPMLYESGTSVHRRARISKKGNVYLRAGLYMPAMVASTHEPHVRAFYDHLLAHDKTPLQAITAVMRKLLHAIYGMWKHDCDFEGEKFYAIEA